MNLDLVTITGADDSTAIRDIILTSREFPKVEWGILLSLKQEGNPRYPSYEWLDQLYAASKEFKLRLSAHICGRWVRNLIGLGDFFMLEHRPHHLGMFQRFQLNFHAERQERPVSKEFLAVLTALRFKEFIFQQDGVNDNLFRDVWAVNGMKCAVPLYDISGGCGILPERWPPAYEGVHNGYAGGLGPDNLEEELPKIAKAAGKERFWIDVETKVRTDEKLDIDKVKQFLEIATKVSS